MYSQYDEEVKILEYFGKSFGRFLDVGAHNGKSLSNTYQLGLNGWSGVVVEPCPMLVQPLLDNLRGMNVRVVNAAIGVTRSLSSFKISGTSFGATLVDANVEKWKKDLVFTEIWVAPITWAVLFQTFPPPYDFISIDCEGMSEVLAETLAEHYGVGDLGVRAMCVEKDPGDHGELEHMMTVRLGLRKYHETIENLIYVK